MSNNIDLENWMQNLPQHLQTTPMKNLAIPGSHDSGAFYLDKNSGIAPNESKILKYLTKVFGSCAKNIIYKWSITQNLSFSQQLKNGIRYFDLRVAYEPKTKDFKVVHGLYGSSYSTVFEDINYFLNLHPKEVVILDFNEIMSFTSEARKIFMSKILKTFESKMYGPGKLGTVSSLHDIWNLNKQMIVVIADAEMLKLNPLLWSQASIFSPWFNTANINTLITDLDKRFNDLKDGCFNVFQAILSPQTTTIVGHLINGSLKKTLAEGCDQHVCTWLQDVANKKKKGVNIVMCDFIGLLEMAEKTVALNYI